MAKRKKGATMKLDVRAVRMKMAEKGITTQLELGERIGLSKNAMSALLNGKASPSLDTIGNLCEALGCMPNDILRFTAEPARER